LSNTTKQLTTRLRVVGVALLFVFVATVFVVGKGNKPNFDAEHRTQIQSIANSLCAAAADKSCNLSWTGKSKWFGEIEPTASGIGKVGLDHIRATLPMPVWQESSQPNGVAFRNSEYEVFYSTQSGAVTITTATAAESR
jgi:hypothetical protein